MTKMDTRSKHHHLGLADLASSFPQRTSTGNVACRQLPRLLKQNFNNFFLSRVNSLTHGPSHSLGIHEGVALTAIDRNDEPGFASIWFFLISLMCRTSADCAADSKTSAARVASDASTWDTVGVGDLPRSTCRSFHGEKTRDIQSCTTLTLKVDKNRAELMSN